MVTFTKNDSVEKELVLQSVPEEISRVEQFVDQLNEEFGFKEDVYANILVAVTEAVNNGILHGNRENPDKKVVVRGKMLNPYRLSVTVIDEGKGFDHENLRDPTDPTNLLNEHGRGVFVMEHLSDEIIFHGTGNTVEMRFNI